MEVSLASALSAEGGSTAANTAASVLAGGIVLSGKAGATVKNFDEQHNISLRVQIAAEMAKAKALEFDEQHGLVSRCPSYALPRTRIHRPR